ncbi:MAG: M20/M25/M40 family metallo-hydrolase [Desulfarculaceae bacterium]|jgi:succinyl-diaminopimelate desuccinylase
MLLEKYTDLLSHISERELVEITRNLVRFQSVNPPGNELPIAKYAAEFLSKEGLEVEILEHADNRGSLVAKLGGGNEPGLIYSGHLDVVKPEGEWHRDPFAAEVAEGKIWGRGTSDMKSGVASIIAAVSAMARTGLKLKGPLYLSLTAGEETGCLGAEETIKRYPFKPVQAVFIAEPSENEVITA